MRIFSDSPNTLIDEMAAYRRLLSAVVALAVKDACRQTPKEFFADKGLSFLITYSATFEALEFLFLRSDGYLAALELDPQQFRRKLLDYAYLPKIDNTNPFNLDANERRRFRVNYQRWFELQSQKEALL